MIHSLLTTDNSINSTEQLRSWIDQRNREVQVDVQLIPFKEMDGWYVDDQLLSSEKNYNLIMPGHDYSIVAKFSS